MGEVIVFTDKESAINTLAHCIDTMDLDKDDKFYSVRKLEEGYVVGVIDLNRQNIEVEPLTGKVENGEVILDS